MFSIEFSRKAAKFMESPPKGQFRRIAAVSESLGAEQFPRGAIKLKGEAGMYRIRVGNYRILYEVYSDGEIILIANVDKRSRAYDF